MQRTPNPEPKMTTYPTLAEALAIAPTKFAKAVVEFDHATEGRRFVLIACHPSEFAKAIRQTPVPEIVALIGACMVPAAPVVTVAEKCERCGKDATTSRKEWSRFNGRRVQVTAHYCTACDKTLAVMANN